MHKPRHEARGNSVYVGRVEVARFNDEYAARKFAEYANRENEARAAIAAAEGREWT